MQGLRMLEQAGQCWLFFGVCWYLFNEEIILRNSLAVALVSSSFPKMTPESHSGSWRQLLLLLSLCFLRKCCLASQSEIETGRVKCEVLQGGWNKFPQPPNLPGCRQGNSDAGNGKTNLLSAGEDADGEKREICMWRSGTPSC